MGFWNQMLPTSKILVFANAEKIVAAMSLNQHYNQLCSDVPVPPGMMTSSYAAESYKANFSMYIRSCRSEKRQQSLAVKAYNTVNRGFGLFILYSSWFLADE